MRRETFIKFESRRGPNCFAVCECVENKESYQVEKHMKCWENQFLLEKV